MLIDREILIEALEAEVASWDGDVPESVSVPGQFLADVLKMLRDGGDEETDEG